MSFQDKLFESDFDLDRNNLVTDNSMACVVLCSGVSQKTLKASMISVWRRSLAWLRSGGMC